VILVTGESQNVSFGNLQRALSVANTQLRLFGKPAVSGTRRMGVALATGDSIEQAKASAIECSSKVSIML
jgi:phosphoribosylglycinamide formyltransferase 2